MSLDGFALYPAALEAQERPAQHVGSAMAGSRDHRSKRTSVGAGNYQEYLPITAVMTSMAGTSPAIDVGPISLTSAPDRRQAAPRLAVRGRQ